MRSGLVCVLVALAACDGGSNQIDPDAPPSSGSGTLGMNDVSILLPLPATKAAPTLVAMTGDGSELVPRTLFTRIAGADIIDTFEDFHLVAIRFDLCDRHAAGPCPTNTDGRLRLVFQPIVATPSIAANDVALHAFYPIPAAELPSAIAELRELSALGAISIDAPLGVTTALAQPGYRDRLRAFVLRYAVASQLRRLTFFAQNANAAAFRWDFRGLDLDNGNVVDITIPTVGQSKQFTILFEPSSYQVTPVADVPAGFALATNGNQFASASATDQRGALEALAAIQNPLTHTAETVQCASCHLATILTSRRATIAGIDPLTIAGRYTAPYDLAISGGNRTQQGRSLRAFGWFFVDPAISQRVVNDTAQTLLEIDQRY